MFIFTPTARLKSTAPAAKRLSQKKTIDRYATSMATPSLKRRSTKMLCSRLLRISRPYAYSGTRPARRYSAMTQATVAT